MHLAQQQCSSSITDSVRSVSSIRLVVVETLSSIFDLRCAVVVSSTNGQQPHMSIRRLEISVRELKTTKTALIARYKAHSMSYAPTLMPMDCLHGFLE